MNSIILVVNGRGLRLFVFRNKGVSSRNRKVILSVLFPVLSVLSLFFGSPERGAKDSPSGHERVFELDGWWS